MQVLANVAGVVRAVDSAHPHPLIGGLGQPIGLVLANLYHHSPVGGGEVLHGPLFSSRR